MSSPPIADVIELEQLLARYAVGMTKDDVDAVVEVFTPDGTYSAFGDTYRLVDFPTLVAAAPKGLHTLTFENSFQLPRQKYLQSAQVVRGEAGSENFIAAN